MPRAVLLDIDGTLVDSNEAHARAWSEALARHGISRSPAQIRRWIGMGGDKILAQIDDSLNEKHEPGKSILKLRLEIFLEQYAPYLRATPGAVALLERLHSANILRVAATSAKKAEFGAIVQAAGIAGHIDLATTADDAERSKPDADIVQSAMAKAGATVAEAVYLGDTPYDVTAAHRAGIPAIALECGGWSAAELAEAEEIYATPAALLRDFDRSSLSR